MIKQLVLASSLSAMSTLGAQELRSTAEFQRGIESALPSSAGLVAALQSKMHLAVHARRVLPNHHMGALGEAVAAQVVSADMKGTGNWEKIHSSFGRNGLDLVHLRYGKDGLPNKVQTGEVKSGSSQLKTTQSGLQASPEYVAHGLGKLGQRWASLANELAHGHVGLGSRAEAMSAGEQIPVIQGAKTICYYRDVSSGQWKYDGQSHDENLALRQVRRGSLLLLAGGKSQIAVGRRVVHVDFIGNKAEISIYNAPERGLTTTIRRLELNRRISMPAERFGNILSEPLANQIARKSPGMSRSEAFQIADEIRAANRDLRSLARLRSPGTISSQYLKGTAWGAGSGAALASVFDVGSQILGSEKYAPLRTLKSAGVGALAGGSFALTYQGSLQFITVNRLLATGAAKFASAGAATIVVSVGFAYIGYFMGAWDISQANRHAAIGVISYGVGLAAGVLATGSMAGAMSGPGALVVIPVTIVVSGVLYVTCDWWDNRSNDQTIMQRLEMYRGNWSYLGIPSGPG